MEYSGERVYRLLILDLLPDRLLSLSFLICKWNLMALLFYTYLIGNVILLL